MFAVVDWPSNLGLRPSGVEALPSALRRAGLISRLRARDAGRVAPQAEYDALKIVARDDLSGFWCHLDADVLDDAVMPAVDYRQDGGMTPVELTELLRRAANNGRMIGFSVAIYNPALDPNGDGARLLVEILDHAFAQQVVGQ